MISRRLIVVVGPTGSGKTDLSISLAQRYHAPILSTDSRQFYRGIAIGTAQPTTSQLLAAEHHFIASHELTDELNCGRYEVVALELLEKLFENYSTVIAVGGSGLYIKALCEGMDSLPPADESLRAQLSARLKTEGLESLASQLRELDPTYCVSADMCNPARVVRALEVCLQMGLPYSSLRTGIAQKRNFEIIKIGVTLPREQLYERINQRVDCMMADGLLAEAHSVFAFRHLNSLRTVGFSELFDHFDSLTTLPEAVELIKRNSRRYAKRQLTWFRRDPHVHWYSPDQLEMICLLLDKQQ